jgi:hypothetical protein
MDEKSYITLSRSYETFFIGLLTYFDKLGHFIISCVLLLLNDLVYKKCEYNNQNRDGELTPTPYEINLFTDVNYTFW